nr:MAG: capsid protein [Cressdnaviricota sp.]
MVFRRRRRVVRKTTKKVKLSPGMKKAVKAIAAPLQELKYVANVQTNQTITAGLSSVGGADLYLMVPSVQQGAFANQRLGNQLIPSSIRVHFALYIPQTDPNISSNLYVRILCLSSREIKDYTATTALLGNNLFLNGATNSVSDVPETGPPQASSNLTQYQFYPVNNKAWITHHDKIYHLNKNTGLQNNQGRDVTGGDVPNVSGAGAYHRFCVSLKHKGALKYDKNTDSYPNNFAPFWCAYLWTSDASNALPTVKCATYSQMYFRD